LILRGWILPVIFIVLSPMTGFAIGLTVSIANTSIVRHQRPRRVDRWFHRLQLVSAAAYRLGQGINDAQKGLGIFMTALVSAGMLQSYHVPYWVIICSHLAMGGGTMAGGLAHHQNHGPAHHQADPLWGLFRGNRGGHHPSGTAHFGIPVSTTHTITGAIVGVGASHRPTAVRWGVTRKIVWVWLLTISGAATFGAILFDVAKWLLK
jgi:inorganic phosphate transporter, PiT family